MKFQVRFYQQLKRSSKKVLAEEARQKQVVEKEERTASLIGKVSLLRKVRIRVVLAHDAWQTQAVEKEESAKVLVDDEGKNRFSDDRCSSTSAERGGRWEKGARRKGGVSFTAWLQHAVSGPAIQLLHYDS